MFCIFGLKNGKKLFYISVICFATACVNNLKELSHQENYLRSQNFYSSYLALEYLEYSRALAQNHDWKDSQYFAKKGLDVSKGYPVILESPHYWRAAMLEMEDLVTAQKRYEAVALDKIKHILPIQMAHLTFLYDCWVSNEAKSVLRLGEMARCKVRFYKLLEEVEYFVANMNKTAPQTTIDEMQVWRYLVFFDFDKYTINEKAQRQIIEILNAIDDMEGDYILLLAGHADRMGKNLYNEHLSLNRIKAVKNYLIANGVPRKVIETRSMGEDYPDIITKNQRQQQFNRTTEVYIIKGARSVKNMPLPLIKSMVFQREIEQIHRERGL